MIQEHLKIAESKIIQYILTKESKVQDYDEVINEQGMWLSSLESNLFHGEKKIQCIR